MRDISELDKAFNKYIIRLKKNISQSQQRSTETMYEDVKERIELPSEARNISQFVEYANSLSVSPVRQEESEFKSSVYSDLVINDGSKWDGVPIGAFLEWGTGPLGEESNTYPHGYPYTTMFPWDEHTAIQFEQINTWGITARPHMYPALISAKQYFTEDIKEAVEESWKT